MSFKIDRDLLAAARALGPLILEHRAEGERNRRVPAAVVRAMKEAGLIRMMTPKSLGGLEADPVTCARVFEEVARFDSAASWILQAANSGDALAVRVLEEAGEHLGVGISYLMNLLNPQMIVIGGGVVDGSAHLIDSVRASSAKHTLNHETVKIAPSALGDQGVLVGAVLSAMDLSVRSYRVVATGERVVHD